MSVQILVGDCLDVLKELPDNSVHCCVTSPPYWGLRDYGGEESMIGLEPTFEGHLENIVSVFREVRRVLRDDGTLWLNYGDAYSSGNRKDSPGDSIGGPFAEARGSKERRKMGEGIKPKDLMLMPAQVALALRDDGWFLRSEIVWHKPNPMPESVKDRPTSAHEKVFLFTKQEFYFYDAEAVKTEAKNSADDVRRLSQASLNHKSAPNEKNNGLRERKQDVEEVSHGANLRNVWPIPVHPLNEAHFATFPPALVEPCIKAGTSEAGCCKECGAPRIREYEKELVKGSRRPSATAHVQQSDANDMGFCARFRWTYRRRLLLQGQNDGIYRVVYS